MNEPRSESNWPVSELLKQLGAARVAFKEFGIDPWESDCPQIKNIWNELTNPQRLDDLRRLASEMSPMNFVAQRIMDRAIEDASKYNK